MLRKFIYLFLILVIIGIAPVFAVSQTNDVPSEDDTHQLLSEQTKDFQYLIFHLPNKISKFKNNSIFYFFQEVLFKFRLLLSISPEYKLLALLNRSHIKTQEAAGAVLDKDFSQKFLEKSLGYSIFYLDKADSYLNKLKKNNQTEKIVNKKLWREIWTNLFSDVAILDYLQTKTPDSGQNILEIARFHLYQGYSEMIPLWDNQENAIEEITEIFPSDLVSRFYLFKELEVLEELSGHIQDSVILTEAEDEITSVLIDTLGKEENGEIFSRYIKELSGNPLVHFYILENLKRQCYGQCSRMVLPMEEIMDDKLNLITKGMELRDNLDIPKQNDSWRIFLNAEPYFRKLRLFEMFEQYLDVTYKYDLADIHLNLWQLFFDDLNSDNSEKNLEYLYSLNEPYTWLVLQKGLKQLTDDKLIEKVKALKLDLVLKAVKKIKQAEGGEREILDVLSWGDPDIILALEKEKQKLSSSHKKTLSKIEDMSFSKIIERVLREQDINALRVIEKKVNSDSVLKKGVLFLESDFNLMVERRKMEIDMEVKDKILRIKKEDAQREAELRRLLKHKRMLIEQWEAKQKTLKEEKEKAKLEASEVKDVGDDNSGQSLDNQIK